MNTKIKTGISVGIILAITAIAMIFFLMQNKKTTPVSVDDSNQLIQEDKENKVAEKKIKKDVLFDLPTEGKLSFSRDLEHYAYSTVQINGDCLDGKCSIIIDGNKTEYEYDRLFDIKFNSNNEASYIYEHKGKRFVVIGNWKSKGYDQVNLFFSPSGKHYYYIAKDGAKDIFVFDGKQFDYKVYWSVFFSANEDSFAYFIPKGNKLAVSINGNVSNMYEAINSVGASFSDPMPPILFSTDGKHYAYIASSGGKSFVVKDGKELKMYDNVNDLAMSADGSKVSYSASNKQFKKDAKERIYDTKLIVSDNFEDKTINNLGGFDMTFSPDGNHLAYKYGKNVFLDGEKYEADRPSNLTFSPDSQHFFFTEPNAIILDGERKGGYGSMHEAKFSPDSQRLGYRADNYYTFKDGAINKDVSPQSGNGYAAAFQFSNDGKHVVFYAKKNGINVAVLDGMVYETNLAYSHTVAQYGISFSSDSKELIFFSIENNKLTKNTLSLE